MEAELALRALGALAVIGALLLALRFLAAGWERFATGRGSPRPGRLLRVVESAALPGSCSLHLVAAPGRYLVVGRSGASVTLLCELPDDR